MAALLERIKSQGYTLTLLDADKIGITPPPVQEVRQLVINHKAELLAELAVNDEQFPADLMAVLDKHYGLTEACDYQFVLDDIHARRDMWEWAAKEANRLIQNLICNKGTR